jgi:hypothetical protein
MNRDSITKDVWGLLVSTQPTTKKAGEAPAGAAMAEKYNQLRQQVIDLLPEASESLPPSIPVQKLSYAEWTQTSMQSLHNYLRLLHNHLTQ